TFSSTSCVSFSDLTSTGTSRSFLAAAETGPNLNDPRSRRRLVAKGSSEGQSLNAGITQPSQEPRGGSNRSPQFEGQSLNASVTRPAQLSRGEAVDPAAREFSIPPARTRARAS